jgi:hypothetical protein
MGIRNNKGQGLIEYIILVAIIGVGTVVLVRKLQQTVSVNMANIVHGMQSDSKRKHSFIRVDDNDVRMKDFTNFMNGTTDRNESQ